MYIIILNRTAKVERITNNQMIQSHQTGNKKMEKPHKSRRCLFLPNKERNKKPGQMPISIASKVKVYQHVQMVVIFVCSFSY